MKLTLFSDISDRLQRYHANKGNSRGLSTGWACVDEYFTLRKGQLHIVTGIPSSGKSEIVDQLMLNTIALHDWHWTIFSPENWPIESHFQKIAEKWTGKPMFTQGHVNGISRDELDATAKRLSSNMAFVDSGDESPTLDNIIKAVEQSYCTYGTDAVIIDPWNEIEVNRDKNKTETEYISEALSKLRNLGRAKDIAVFVVAHPTKLQKRDDGNYPCPTPYDISGSSHWRNKADACLAVWRDYGANDGVVEFHIQKMRNKNLGKLGMVNLHWLWSNGIFAERRVEGKDGESLAVKHKAKDKIFTEAEKAELREKEKNADYMFGRFDGTCGFLDKAKYDRDKALDYNLKRMKPEKHEAYCEGWTDGMLGLFVHDYPELRVYKKIGSDEEKD